MAGAAGSDERKIATVLFADLAGSTALADREDPERVRARLERFYEAMQAEIALAGGTTEKFVGDAVMAVFGAPAAQEDHAERALHAALAMQRRLHELFGGELGLRVGVNTGEVVAGTPREGSSFVSGDSVNVAARLEQAAEPGEILAGERTVAAVRGAFEFDDAKSVEAKGKPGGVTCRRLVRALSLQRPRGVSGLSAAFVGRDEELGRLQAGYEQVVAERSPRLELILGDPGVGKTRLVRELWQWLAAREPQPLQRTGRCLSYGQIAYWALGEILKEHLGLLDSDGPEAALDRLQEREILGLALGLDVAGGLHPLVARDRFQDAWAALLEELSAERPVALLVEDLHWAEEPLLDVLEHLLKTVRGPLLVIATARPEFQEQRPGFKATETIALDPLPADASEQLLAGLLGADPPADLLPAIAPAEGNPFFVEEVLASLLDRGLLERRNGGWVLHEHAGGLGVPDTVQAVVAARIDLLDAADKAALQAASLIGRIFWSGPVYELLEGLEPDLHVLEERDFIRRRHGSAVEGEREYAIKHAVTREVAYASIPKAKRARLHAAFAAWLERFGGGRDEHAPLLAHHYAEAVRAEDVDLAWPGEGQELERLRGLAAAWLERSVRLALGRGEVDDGLAVLRRALELCPDRASEARIWKTIGFAQALRFDGEGFWTATLKALDLADEDEAGELYSQLAFHTTTRKGMWKSVPDQAMIDGWIERALELTAPGSPAHVQALISRAYSHRAPDESAAVEAVRQAEATGDIELRSYAWMARAAAAFSLFRFDEAVAWSGRRLEIVDEIDDPDQQVEVYETAVAVTAGVGRLREARRLAQKHVELSARLTPHHRMHGMAMVVETEENAGCWERLLELVTPVEAAAAANADTPCTRNARCLLVCALAAELSGDAGEAERLERLAVATGFDLASPPLVGPRTRLAMAREDRAEVARLVHEAPQVFLAFGPAPLGARLDALVFLGEVEAIEAEAPPLLRPGSYVEPFALRALGVARGDEQLLARADARFAAMGLAWHRAQTDALLRV